MDFKITIQNGSIEVSATIKSYKEVELLKEMIDKAVESSKHYDEKMNEEIRKRQKQD